MTENEVIREDRAEKLRQEQQTKEREAMKKNHLEALISEWKFQCAEGIETYPRDRMFEICYEDAYKQGKKEATKECNNYYQNELEDLYKDYAKRLEELREENGQAKEIIKGLLASCFGYDSKTVNYELKAKAEAFLKE